MVLLLGGVWESEFLVSFRAENKGGPLSPYSEGELRFILYTF